ncbi:MAG TPA: hypothetical protein VIL18_07205 [Longimicrobiales bacterium]
MSIDEIARGRDVLAQLTVLDEHIASTARMHGVDPGLMKAIVYGEQTHQLPFEALAESLGLGKTVGLGQVTVGMNRFSRQVLLDPATNVTAMAAHLMQLQREPLIDPRNPIASLATRYNCGACTAISPYGRRVHAYYLAFFKQE